MDEGHPLLCVLLYLVFVIFDAILFGFGTAIQNVNETELERRLETGDKKAGKILRILDRPGNFVNTIQIVSILMGYVTGGILTAYFVPVLAAAWTSPLGKYGARFLADLVLYLGALMMMVSLGMVVPKRLAQRNPEKWAYRTFGTVSFLMMLFRLVILPVHGLSYVILRACGIDMNRREENVTEEDIMSMVNEGHEQGVVESDEAEMITNVFQLNDKQASDVMTHRKNVTGLDAEGTLRNAVDFMLTEGNNSRYPVYRKNIDNIIGVLNMKDALIFSYKGENKDRKLSEIPGLLREAHFIPETRALNTLFKEMQSEKIHMEVVVDEYGQTSGIVTMEDILEEIVGNIMDEYDDDEEMVTPLNNGSYIMNGMTMLEDVTDAVGVQFTEEEYNDFDTLNGFLISRLDRIPSDGEQFTVEAHGYEFRVLHVKDKTVRSVRVTERKKESEGGEAGAKEKTATGRNTEVVDAK